MTKLIQGVAALGIPLSLLAAGGAHAELKVRMPLSITGKWSWNTMG
jgi:hypothetical protein